MTKHPPGEITDVCLPLECTQFVCIFVYIFVFILTPSVTRWKVQTCSMSVRS